MTERSPLARTSKPRGPGRVYRGRCMYSLKSIRTYPLFSLFRYSGYSEQVMMSQRMVICRSCKELKPNYAKDLCARCYGRERMRSRRGSLLLDKNLTDPQVCSVKNCTRFVAVTLGMPMCQGHHDDYYHSPGQFFWDFHCPCGTVG